MKNLPKIALGAWAWGNGGTFGNEKHSGAPECFWMEEKL